MFACTCGRTFPGTLDGAWEAKVHAAPPAHALRESARAPAPVHAAQGA